MSKLGRRLGAAVVWTEVEERERNVRPAGDTLLIPFFMSLNQIHNKDRPIF